MIIGLAFHIAAAVIWVGGMFFAYVALRPSAGPLEPALRLPLWHRVFGRFFPWVWASILALLASGYGMVFFGLGGFRGVGLHVHVMQTTGIIMVLDRKSTRLNSSHLATSYAVFCLKKNKTCDDKSAQIHTHIDKNDLRIQTANS